MCDLCKTKRAHLIHDRCTCVPLLYNDGVTRFRLSSALNTLTSTGDCFGHPTIKLDYRYVQNIDGIIVDFHIIIFTQKLLNCLQKCSTDVGPKVFVFKYNSISHKGMLSEFITKIYSLNFSTPLPMCKDILV